MCEVYCISVRTEKSNGYYLILDSLWTAYKRQSMLLLVEFFF